MSTDDVTLREVTILLVDDDDVDAIGVVRALKKLKISNPVVRAHDGVEALELLRHPTAIQRPYMVLLDINMPRMNGLEMLAQLRSDPQLVRAVVFVLTTSHEDEDKLGAHEKNVAGYIVKNHVGDGFLRAMELLDCWRQSNTGHLCQSKSGQGLELAV
jgi:CheY-like chemotaxis protein